MIDTGKTILIVTHDPTITTRTQRTIIISDGELVNETVGRALPLLNHNQMLNVTRLIERRIIQPGADILHAGGKVANFYMIASGEVEVLIQARNRAEQTAAMLGPGQFFGEVELLRGGNSLATIRAAQDGPVELLVLPHDEFMKMISGSPLTAEALGKIVQHRLAENQMISKGRRVLRNDAS